MISIDLKDILKILKSCWQYPVKRREARERFEKACASLRDNIYSIYFDPKHRHGPMDESARIRIRNFHEVLKETRKYLNRRIRNIAEETVRGSQNQKGTELGEYILDQCEKMQKRVEKNGDPP